MAELNDRGGWDISDAEAAEVIARSLADKDGRVLAECLAERDRLAADLASTEAERARLAAVAERYGRIVGLAIDVWKARLRSEHFTASPRYGQWVELRDRFEMAVTAEVERRAR